VNPVYGLYTSIAAPIGGNLLVSAQLMRRATTWAAAFAAAQALRSYPAGARDGRCSCWWGWSAGRWRSVARCGWAD
jgi:hypothetical protein